MPVNEHTRLSDRQARAVIIAAERVGFEREPDLYAPHYDHALHEDAVYAVRHLRLHDPDALRDALIAPEPIAAASAAARITDSGRFSFADADLVIAAAAERGFVPPTTDLPLLPSTITWDQARACVAFLWEEHPAHLEEVIGDVSRLAPLPETARLLHDPAYDS